MALMTTGIEAANVAAAALVGAGATLALDLWNLFLRQALRVPLPDFCLLGRWFLHMPGGRFAHASIASAPRRRSECAVGWIAHYAIGVLFALIFVALAPTGWLARPTLLPALLFGLGTVLFPYLVMQPAYGFGVAASKTPDPSAARLKSLMSHGVFGLGLYLSAELAMSVIASGDWAQDPARPADRRPALLRSLDGQWVMTGDVLGETVTYDMVAGPVLHGSFTEMHMKDVQVPSEYEARVFIGVDPDSQVVIAHWLDNFGAKYSIPHGTGQVSGDTIQFTIPYDAGPFRDTLIFHPENHSWSFAIEASQPDGSWKHFARYEMRRGQTDRP